MKENEGKKPIYKKWWFWLIVIIIAIAILGSSNNSDNTTSIRPEVEKTTNNDKVTTTQEKTEYNQGEEAILGKGAITVTSVEKSQGSTYDKPKTGKEFVIVHIMIENKGNTNLSYNPFYFKMQNSQGQQEDETFTTIDQDTSLKSGELIPGGKVEGTLAFEEPINDTGLVLIYSDNIWSSNSLRIKLQ